MKLLRFVLAILISLTIPAVATAALAASIQATACPMQQSNMATTLQADKHDCCETKHADLHAKSGGLCKTGELCKLGASYPVAADIPALPSPPPDTLSAISIDSAFLSHDPAELWRPPRTI